MICFYCNEKDPRGYGGLDRIDSADREYRKDNCVPACKICNYMKKSWTQKSFILLSNTFIILFIQALSIVTV